MTDNKGEHLIPVSRSELIAPQKNPFEVLLEERFKNFTKGLTEKNAPFVYVPREDKRKERFPMDLNLTQEGCVFWDIIPADEKDVLSQHELLRKPYSDLQREEGDSLDFPINTLGRVALRRIKNKTGDEVWAYTIEVGGKIDTRKAAPFSDFVAQGVTRGIPSYIQINTANRSQEDLTARLDLALHLVEPNLFNPNYNPLQDAQLASPMISLPEVQEESAPTTVKAPLNEAPTSGEAPTSDEIDDLLSYLNGPEDPDTKDTE